jgi:hypothetical protein
MTKQNKFLNESILTDYQIEFIAVDFFLKPEKIPEKKDLNWFKDKKFSC